MYEPRDVLLYYSVITEGDWDEIYRYLRAKTPLPDPSLVGAAIAPFRDHALTIFDEDYPEWLRKISRPPFVLYYKGDIKLLQEQEHFVVCAGNPEEGNAYADKMSEDVGQKVAENGDVLVSPFSKGPSLAAIYAASKAGKAIGVLCCGIKKIYPIESKPAVDLVSPTGLVISEFPDFASVSPTKMKQRQVLLGQMGKFVYIPNCSIGNSSMILLSYALQRGCDAGALPYRSDEKYLNNQLIQEGAAIILSPEDVLFEAGLLKRGGDGKKIFENL